MKEGWKLEKLKDVCDNITDGTHQTPKYFDEGFIFLSSRNVTSGKINWSNIKYIDEKQHIDLHKRVAPKVGDILLAKNGTTGVAAMVDKDVVFDIYVSLALLRSKGEVSPYYLLHFINSPVAKKQFNSRLKGIGVPNLHLKEIREVEIPYPKIEEQQAIVEKLDFAFDAIEKAKANIEKNIENAKELFQSKLNEIFSQKGEGNKKWVFKKLSDIFDVRDGTHDSPKYQESGFALVTSKNLKKGKITLDKIKFICEKDYININKRSNVSKGDILFAMIGTIGNPVVIVEEPDFAIKNVALIKSNKENNSYFFSYYLDLEMVIKKMQDESKGTTQRFVSLGYMRNFEVPCPKIEIQNKIVKQIDQLSEQTDLLQEKYKQKLANLEELKKSILEKAFKGELV